MAILTTPTSRSIRESTPDAARSVDIEAWTTAQAAQTLIALAPISLPHRTLGSPRGASVTIEIPLDEPATSTPLATGTHPVDADKTSPVAAAAARPRPGTVHTVHRRRSLIERDSLRRRDALLKGKEGSRRRQRWENDRLLSNPHAVPPLPTDWDVTPTYTVHREGVPYNIAPLWEAEYKKRAAAASAAAAAVNKTVAEMEVERVQKELRQRLKRSRGAKGLLQDLENEVRKFVSQWEEGEQGVVDDDDTSADMMDEYESDEEIVFVGRNGEMSDESPRQRKTGSGSSETRNAALRKERMVFESAAEDRGAAFGRWLVHSIAVYYGLKTWSVTTGDPARREAYVGLKDASDALPHKVELPRPLWGLV